MHETRFTTPDEQYAALTENQLMDCLKKCDDRFNNSEFREEMAPMLYHLRLKLRAPGREGEGFEKWVDDNLSVSIRTANRWASWYQQQSRPCGRDSTVPEAETPGDDCETDADTSNADDEEAQEPEYATRDDRWDAPELPPDQLRPVPVQLMLNAEQARQFDNAVARLREQDDLASPILFNAAVTAAAGCIPFLSGEVVQ